MFSNEFNVGKFCSVITVMEVLDMEIVVSYINANREPKIPGNLADAEAVLWAKIDEPIQTFQRRWLVP